MSQLTDSLNQIKHWLEENCPQAAENITPGLTLSEIESKIENLPFSLPNELGAALLGIQFKAWHKA